MPNGRITPEDVGIWKDSQIEPIAKVVEFAHSQNQKIMIQLAHAGRKASTIAPWLSGAQLATKDLNGWPDNVWAPSAIPWDENHATPKEMTLAQIDEFKAAFAASVQRSIKAGFDAIEIHSAHGELVLLKLNWSKIDRFRLPSTRVPVPCRQRPTGQVWQGFRGSYATALGSRKSFP